MNASKMDVIDLDFIFNEMVRLKKLFNLSYEAYSKDFTGIYGPFGASIDAPKSIVSRSKDKNHIQLYLSEKAQKQLWIMTRRKIKENKIELILSDSDLLHEIRDSIYIHVVNQQSLDSSGYSKLLSRALKSAKRKIEKVRYFLPFNAAGIDASTEISFGKVTLLHRELLFDKIEDNERIEEYRKNKTNFNSFLCVEIEGCSIEMSKKRVNSVANLVYAIIQLFGLRCGVSKNHVSLESNPSPIISDNYIAYHEATSYSLCNSSKFATGFDDYWDNLSSEFDTHLGEIILKLIDYAISPTDRECIADRLIDSIYWFGEASRDNNNSSQIVKLATSLERLVTLSIDKKDEYLTSRFCDRLGCLIANFQGEIDKWKQNARELYVLRSKLVHGSKALYKSHDTGLSFDPFMFSSIAIFSTCVAFNKVGLDKTQKYESVLLKLFNHLNEDCYKSNTDAYVDKRL